MLRSFIGSVRGESIKIALKFEAHFDFRYLNEKRVSMQDEPIIDLMIETQEGSDLRCLPLVDGPLRLQSSSWQTLAPADPPVGIHDDVSAMLWQQQKNQY